MRNILFLLAAAFCAALASCDDDNGKLADGTCIFINGKDKTNKAASTSAKTVKEKSTDFPIGKRL